MATTDSTVAQQSASDTNNIPNSFSQSEMKNINPAVKTKMDKFNSFVTKYKQLDSANHQLSIDNAKLSAQLVNYNKLEQENETLKQENQKLTTELQEAIANQSPVAALASPSGCAVLIVLIIAITAIALKKGLSISKGDAKVSIGGEEKK